MKRYKFLIVFLLFIGNVQITFSQDELHIRNGLKNFYSKLKNAKGNQLIVAFLGGSITEADNGWRDKVFVWLQQQYPAVSLTQINAGIGGTGSDLGVYRLYEQVLKYKPDLLFIEFAVNDFDVPRDKLLKSIEGIVLKTLAAGHTDICFIYTFNDKSYSKYINDSLPNSVAVMEEVATYYNLPSINVGLTIAKLIEQGRMFLKGPKPVAGDSTFFSGDGVHPYPETGHLNYFKTISASLEKIFITNPVQKKIKSKPYFSNALQKAGMQDFQPYMMQGAIQQAATAGDDVMKPFLKMLPHTFLLNDTAQQIAFSFIGNRIGFMDILAPSSAELTVYIDDEKPRYINRFDEYCFYFSRMHWFFIEGLTEGRHTIRIKLSSQQPDKFLMLDKNKDKSSVDKREEYQKYIWRAGKILVDGWLGRK